MKESTTENYPHAIESWLPLFPGFYNTLFEPFTESLDESFRYYASKDESGEYGLEYENVEFWFDGAELWDTFYTFENGQYEAQISKAVTDHVETMLRDMFGDCIKVEYQSVFSPREYNFKNNSINVCFRYTDEFLVKLAETMNGKAKQLAGYFKEKFTSYDGFISFYDNTVVKWRENTAEWTEFDSTEFGAILEAVLSCVYDGDHAIGEDVDLYYAIDEEKTNAEMEATTCLLPKWDELPETVRDALGKLDAFTDTAQAQVDEYARLMPEYAGKAHTDHHESLKAIRAEYIGILKDYLDNKG